MRDSRTFKAGVIAFSKGSGALAGLAIAAVLARRLTKVDYATYQQTLLVYGFAAPLLGLGLPGALLYFMPRSPERERSLVTEALLLLSAIGLVFSCFLYIGGADFVAARFSNPALSETLSWFALYPLFALPMTALGPCLVATNHVERAAAFTVIASMLRMALVILPILLIGPDPLYAIQATVVVSALVFVPGVLLMQLAAESGTRKPSLGGAWEQLIYAFPLGISSILGMLTVRMDKILVGVFVPPEEFATYVNGAMEVPLIGIITGSVAVIILPDLVRLYGAGDIKECQSLWVRGGVKAALIMWPVAVFLFIAAPELMALIYSVTYLDSAEPFRIYVCALPFRVVMYGAVLQAAGMSRVILTRTALTLLLNLVLSALLIKAMGANGAAWGTLLSSVCFAVPYNLAIISKIFRVKFRHVFPFGKLMTILIASFVGNLPALAVLKLFDFTSFTGLGVSLVLSTLSCCVVFNFVGLIALREIIDLFLARLRH